MKEHKHIRFIFINQQVSSLYSLIADRRYCATSLGRDTWKSLIGPQASLQPGCNKEGFNVGSVHDGYSKARIGILGNEGNDCSKCDSRIAFGGGGTPHKPNKCGNGAKHGGGGGGDKGNKNVKTWGFIFV